MDSCWKGVIKISGGSKGAHSSRAKGSQFFVQILRNVAASGVDVPFTTLVPPQKEILDPPLIWIDIKYSYMDSQQSCMGTLSWSAVRTLYCVS